MRRITFYTILVFAPIFYTGCEDDAILSPQPESECQPGESYCDLALPNSDNQKQKNPETF